MVFSFVVLFSPQESGWLYSWEENILYLYTCVFSMSLNWDRLIPKKLDRSVRLEASFRCLLIERYFSTLSNH